MFFKAAPLGYAKTEAFSQSPLRCLDIPHKSVSPRLDPAAWVLSYQ